MNVCFSRDQLLDFTLGKMHEQQARDVERHIDECAACEETVAVLDEATDSLLQQLRAVRTEGAPTGLPSSVAYELAIEELQRCEIPGPPQDLPEPGDDGEMVTLRDYELLQPLGQGGMGTVYRARHQRLDKLVALKLLPARRMQDHGAVARFQREMRAIGQLDHPSIVRATDAGEVDGNHFLVMELVDGADLGRMVRQTGPLKIPEACEVIRQAATGMQHAHQRGIVHRDLKPSNLMLTSRGTVKILDLGLALLGTNSAGTMDELTTVGQLMGTLDFMAPEQFGDCHTVDQLVDVYSLGATLYKLISGFAPYSGDEYRTPLQKLKGLATADVVDIRERNPDVPAALADVLMRALAREPDERIGSAEELATLLEGHAANVDLQKTWETRSPRLVTPSNADAAALLPVVAEAASTTTSTAESIVAGEVSDRGHGRRWPAIALSAAGAVLLGLLIYVQTNRGTLTISSPRDDVTLQILRAGEPYKTLTVNKGQKSWSLGLGEYEVRLDETADGLVVENDQFVLKRGAEEIATIKADTHSQPLVANQPGRSEGSVPMAVDIGTEVALDLGRRESDGPRFDGRSYADWKRDFLRERSPNVRGQAVQALLALADGEQQRDAIDTIFDHVSPRAMHEIFKDESRNEKNTIAGLLMAYFGSNTHHKLYGTGRMAHEVPRYRAPVLGLLVKMEPILSESQRRAVSLIIGEALQDEHAYIRITALGTAVKFANTIPSMLDGIRDTARNDSEERVRVKAAMLLAMLGKQDHSGIELLARAAILHEDQVSVDALTGLIWLGPKASGAADSLIRFLEGSAKQNEVDYAFTRVFQADDSSVSDSLRERFSGRFPEHAARSPLLAGGQWRQRSGKHRQAVITALGCMGPGANHAVPVLTTELTSLIRRESITWMSLSGEGERVRRSVEHVTHALARIDPQRFPSTDAVLVEVLGPKRVTIAIRANSSTSVPKHISDEISALVQQVTEDVSLDRRTAEQEVREALKALMHPALYYARLELFDGRVFHVSLRFREPVALVRTEDGLIPSDSRGFALDPNWFSRTKSETLPTIDCGVVPPVDVGASWPNDVSQAAQIAYQLRNVWTATKLHAIRRIPSDDAAARQFVLTNEDGSRSFRWGHAPGYEPIGEFSSEKKVARLVDLLKSLYRNPADNVERTLMYDDRD